MDISQMQNAMTGQMAPQMGQQEMMPPMPPVEAPQIPQDMSPAGESIASKIESLNIADSLDEDELKKMGQNDKSK